MQTIGIGELQRNMGILTRLTEPLTIVDKRKNREVAVVYPIEERQPNIVAEMAGVLHEYAKNVDPNKSFCQIREEAMAAAMKEKYGFTD